VDLPPEESENLGKLCADYGLSLVHLATPTSTPERLKLIAQASSGFIYYVSVTGVTGAREQLPEDLIEHLRLVKKFTHRGWIWYFQVRAGKRAGQNCRRGGSRKRPGKVN